MSDNTTADRYRGRNWADMSHYVAHFATDDSVVFDQLLRECSVRPTVEELGFARADGWSMSAVCLSEIPPDELGRLAERHGCYGVGFHVDQLTVLANRDRRRFGRVWYLERGTQLATAAWSAAFSAADLEEGSQLKEALHKLLPYIDVAGVYPGGVTRQFEWEREWRWEGTLRFCHGNLRMVLAPEAEHDRLREAWGNLPYVDPAWPWERASSRIRREGAGNQTYGWNAARIGPGYRWFDGRGFTGAFALGENQYENL